MHDPSAWGRLLRQHRERAKQQMRPIFKKLRNWCKTFLALWWSEALQVSPAELGVCFGSLLPHPPSNRNRIAHILMVSSPDLSFQRINCLSLLRGMNSYGIPALHCVYGKMLSIKWPKCSFSSNPWVIYSIPSGRFMTLFRNMDLKIRNSKHVLNHGSMNSFCKRPDQYFQLVSHTIFTQPS